MLHFLITPRLYSIRALLLLLPAMLQSQAVPRDAVDAGWKLTFLDEFDGPSLDLGKWSPSDLARTGTPLREVHTYAAESAVTRDGQLHLAARRTSTGYQSGMVSSLGKFAQTYGRFEIRCRVPIAAGLRAGFHLMPLPSGLLPSIDVFQQNGNEPRRVLFSNHWGTEQTERSFGDSLTFPDFTPGLHTITIDWAPDHISWALDGKERLRSVDGIPHQPMYLMLDLGVLRGTGLPAGTAYSFDVDSVRVYERK